MRKWLIIILIILWGNIYAQSAEMAESYLQESKGNYELALQSMQKLKVKEPSDAFYQVRIAWLEYLLGRYDASLASYQAALQLKSIWMPRSASSIAFWLWGGIRNCSAKWILCWWCTLKTKS